METAKKVTQCTLCGKEFDAEELDSPRTDEDGDPICDDCYHEHYEFTCRCCQNYGDVKDQHNLLVVFKETSGVLPGIYATKGTYCTHALIGEGWLHPGALARIADVNPDMDGEGYPCGHLCLECQGHVLAQFTDKCRVCNDVKQSCLRVKLGSWKDFKATKYQWTRAKVICAECRHKHRGAWRLVQT